MNHDDLTKLTRRDFLKLAGVGSALFASGANASFLVPLRFPAQQNSTSNSRVSIHTFNTTETSHTDAVRDAILSTTDLSWLNSGDSVFVKVAANSNYSHPSVTSPAVLEGVIKTLKEAGAGTVYVGDMSGAQFVRHLATETIGSTRENLRQTGLLQAAESAGAEIHCFEEVPFDAAYVAGIPQVENHHWGQDLQVAEILDRVDHIVNLPRLGKHVLAGATMGLKNAIGWISDHSRMVLHRDAATFQEKIVEVNAIPQIADKTRLTLTLVDQILATYGPDAGYHYPLNQPLILASEDVVSHDQIGLLILLWARTQLPESVLAEDPYPDETNGLNWWFVRVTWGEEAAAAYQDLTAFASLVDTETPTHINLAWDRLRGGRPDAIEVLASGLPLDATLIAALIQYTALGVLLNQQNA